MNRGYIKLYRKILENPVVCKDNDYFRVWVYLLLNAVHKEVNMIFDKTKITLKPGQLITGRDAIANKCNISSSKAYRILKTLEIEQQIEQQKSSKGTLITVLKYEEYQKIEQQTEQQVNNEWTASEQQVNTNNNDNNVINNNYYLEVERILGPVVSTFIKNKIDELVKVYGGDMFIASVKNAAMNNVKNLNYIEATLRNWKSEGKVHIQNPKQIDEETEPNEIFEYDWLNEK